jgi:hypothetical protein
VITPYAAPESLKLALFALGRKCAVLQRCSLAIRGHNNYACVIPIPRMYQRPVFVPEVAAVTETGPAA